MSLTESNLLQQYNRTQAHVTVLYEQLEKKTAELNEALGKQERQDKVTRAFCESILKKEQDKDAKNNSAWFKKPTLVMLAEAEESYNRYFDDKWQKLKALLEYSKTLSKTIKDLEKELDETKKKLTDYEEQIKLGNIHCSEESGIPKGSDAKLGRTWKRSDAAGAIETDEDYTQKDSEYYKDLDALEEENPKSTFPVTPAAKRVLDEKELAKERKAASDQKVSFYIESATDNEKAILKCIGEKGFSEYAPVIEYLKNEFTQAKVRMTVTMLCKKGIFGSEKVKTPYSPKMYAFWLSEYGKKIYCAITGVEPVESEAEKIRREHTTLEHGYAIIQTAFFLRETPYVKKKKAEVSCMSNRKHIKINEKQSFVPDIIISVKDKPILYIEYETTKCTPEDFNAKCYKLAQAMDIINFIVPAKEELEVITSHAEKWLEKIKEEKTFNKPVTIRISTFAAIKTSKGEDELTWEVSKRTNRQQNRNHNNINYRNQKQPRQNYRKDGN